MSGRTVAILGKACPWAERLGHDVECWGINDGWKQLPGGRHFDEWHRWFDVHPISHINAKRPMGRIWYETQTDLARPIYMTRRHKTIPCSTPYPLREVQSVFQGEEFFTSSLDYCIALALYEGVDRLEIYGADMYASHERQHRDIYRKNQREGASYWMGRARGMGVEVVTQTGSSLCRTEYLYGFHTPTASDNFVSLSFQRFVDQCSEAKRLRAEVYEPTNIVKGERVGAV
jgi:hypothetical protein